MAATVKPIEAKAVHLIQSGQVIVDLCSVVKELVENSLDAGASAVEVRFKNNGLDEIEVQDNGSGIAPANYESVALKHHTSKLSTYDDLANLSTFGFRGEALSSLCALSKFVVTTAQADEAPKGTRLEFASSGQLASSSVVACQKGTIASVSNLFDKLPVRQKELAKNIKREYGKVLGLLHAYACISTNIKFTVKNAMPKAKSMTVFATKSNATTRENIVNVYGAKTLSGLTVLDLTLNLQSSSPTAIHRGATSALAVVVKGHISKPVWGEGRQTPDRQMFFVNGRPCGLPQIAKAINEVYKSFNVSQSPFIFADFQMDTNAYDVNVSPDKRSIFLHNAAALTDSLKLELTSMFENQDQTVPQSQLQRSKLPAFKQLEVRRTESMSSADETENRQELPPESKSPAIIQTSVNDLLHDHFRSIVSTRHESPAAVQDRRLQQSENHQERQAKKIASAVREQASLYKDNGVSEESIDEERQSSKVYAIDTDAHGIENNHSADGDMNTVAQPQVLSQRTSSPIPPELGIDGPEPEILAVNQSPMRPDLGIVQNAFSRMRSRRTEPEIVTITIGDKTVTRIPGSSSDRGGQLSTKEEVQPSSAGVKPDGRSSEIQQFSQRLGRFTSFGTEARRELERVMDDERDTRPQQTHIGSHHETDEESDASISSLPEDKSTPQQREDIDDVADSSISADLSYVDEEERKATEEARVAELIIRAEAAAIRADQVNDKRTAQVLKGGKPRDPIPNLQTTVDGSIGKIAESMRHWFANIEIRKSSGLCTSNSTESSGMPEEERLLLTISKSDFAKMHIIGQFNLGFILAVSSRAGNDDNMIDSGIPRDEMFIIDQHASDEIYNFERLQAETVVGNQRMVRPVVLDLTAVEEEVLLNNNEALEKNGFVVDIDTSGQVSVGQRCQLVSLPLSKEVAFNTRDLDELIHLLNETPMLSDSSFCPRPSKVRKMFAMRACRSSIMIGRTLSKKQMSTVLQHMGSIDKPWNCPHGRPTMRHLASLNTMDASLWHEGDGVCPGQDPAESGLKSASDLWKEFVA